MNCVPSKQVFCLAQSTPGHSGVLWLPNCSAARGVQHFNPQEMKTLTQLSQFFNTKTCFVTFLYQTYKTASYSIVIRPNTSLKIAFAFFLFDLGAKLIKIHDKYERDSLGLSNSFKMKYGRIIALQDLLILGPGFKTNSACPALQHCSTDHPAVGSQIS